MNPIVNLSNYHFEELAKKHITVSEVFLMQRAVEGFNVNGFKGKSISALVKKMIRNGYLTEEYHPTQAGKAWYESLFQEGAELKLLSLEKIEEDFERFWKACPATANIEIGGKLVFKDGRALKTDKERCKQYFLAIISKGEYTTDELIAAVQYEVKDRIEKSLRKKDNQLSWMKAIPAWLNQKVYAATIEFLREQGSVKPESIKQTQKFL